MTKPALEVTPSSRAEPTLGRAVTDPGGIPRRSGATAAVQPESVRTRLARSGFTVPSAPRPMGSYVPFRIAGTQIFVAGQTCRVDGELLYRGTVGADIDLAQARSAAQLCALNVLAIAGLAVDDRFDRLSAVRVTGYMRCTADFGQQAAVLDGASDLLVLALGERGRHARAAIGTNALPGGSPVEIEAVFEIL